MCNRSLRLLRAGLIIFYSSLICNVQCTHLACEEYEAFCTINLLKDVMSAFVASNVTIQDPSGTNSALSTAYANFSARCRGISHDVMRAVRVLTPSNEEQLPTVLSQRFTSETGYRVEFTLEVPTRIADEVKFQFQTNVSVYDAWMLDVSSGEVAQRAGALVQLEGLTASPDVQIKLQDDDVHPFFQNYGAMYDGKRTGVVLGAIVPLLYWRRDMFSAANLSGPPATWEELLAAATVLNGTDLNGDGLPDAALCWQTEECEDAGSVLSSILASMTQYEGLSSGWLLRPEDMSPLATGPPVLRALELFRNLTRLEAHGVRGCTRLHTAFFESTCAITIKSAQQFKAAELYYPHLHGHVGVSPLPGSTWVWNRAASAWMSCGYDSDVSPCPHATLEAPLSLPALRSSAAPPPGSRAAEGTPLSRRMTQVFPSYPRPAYHSSSSKPSPEPSGSSSDGPNPSPGDGSGRSRRRSSEQRALQAGLIQVAAADVSKPPAASVRRVWVNRAPFPGMMALLGSVTSGTAPSYVKAALSFFTLLTSPEISWDQIRTDSVLGPFRLQQLHPDSVPRWLVYNYCRDDLEPFLEANRAALGHPNAALPLRLPGAVALRDVMYWASQQMLVDVNMPEVVAAEIPKRLTAALGVNMKPEELRRSYWSTIGYTSPAGTTGSRGSLFSTKPARIGVGVAVTGLVLLVLVGLIYWRRRLQLRRTLFGRALAPGASPTTSLLVTDIVDSTRLWETVSHTAMTRAIQLHHETLRALLQLHNGYESATEGDAFILSFYSAADAVAFALRAQAALLLQPWPEELFQHAPCTPQYALCPAPGGNSDWPRAARNRLPRGAQSVAAIPGLSLDETAPVGVSGTASGGSSGLGAPGGGGQDAVSLSWLTHNSPPLPLSSTKLRLVTTALSRPLKRRAKRAFGGSGSGVGGGSSATSISLPLPALRHSGRLLVASPHERMFVPLPSAPLMQPGDGFASQSLSQLLLGGSLLVRGLGGDEITATDGSIGITGGDFGGGSGNRSIRVRKGPHRHASQRDVPSLRQLQMTAVRPRSSNAIIAPHVVQASSAITASVRGRAADREDGVSVLEVATAAAVGEMSVPGTSRAVAVAAKSDVEKVSFTEGGHRHRHSTGAGASAASPGAAAAATGDRASRSASAQMWQYPFTVQSGSGSGEVSSHSTPVQRTIDMLSPPQQQQQEQQEQPASQTPGPTDVISFGSCTVVVPDTIINPPAVTPAAQAPESSGPPSVMPVATASSANDVARVVARALTWNFHEPHLQQTTTTADNIDAMVQSHLARASWSLRVDGLHDGGGAAAAVVKTSVSNYMAAFTADSAGAAASSTSRAAASSNSAPASAAAAACDASMNGSASGSGGDGGGGGGAADECVSTLTFSGMWPVKNPPQATATTAATIAAAVRASLPGGGTPPGSSHRSAVSMSLLAMPGDHGNGGGGGRDSNAELEELLATRGSDIRGVSVSAEDSDLDPDPDPDPDPYLKADPDGHPGALHTVVGYGAVEPSFRRRSYRLRTVPSGSLTFGGGLHPTVHPGSSTEKGAKASAPVSTSGLAPAVNNASGALTASLGLVPQRLLSLALESTGFNPTSSNAIAALQTGPLSGSSGGGLIRSLPLGSYYQQIYRSCPPGTPGAVLVAGGLSVRMGIHSGVASTQVSYNRVAGRTQYSGAALEVAKAVCDSAQGGMVLLSAPAFLQLGGASSGREPPHLVLHMGAHVVKGEPSQQHLYMAQSRELLPRMAFLGPVRSLEQVEPGVLEEPLGDVCMGTILVVGLPTLMAWNKDLTEDALATFQHVVVTTAMRRLGGHVVEEEPGKVLAAFGHPFDGIRWAAACEALLKEADWSEALLGHELAEEVQGPVLLDSNMDVEPVLMEDGELSRMLFRGLRIKGAVDCSPVKAELLPATGRMGYRGNLTTNVQRISAFVSTGQVVCTRRAWRSYVAALDTAAEVAGGANIVSACLGQHSIRGMGDKVELWSIRLEDLMFEAPYHEDMRVSIGDGGIGDGTINEDGGGGGGGRSMSMLPSPVPRMASEMASLMGITATLGGDMVDRRLGASYASKMSSVSKMWSVSGDELRNMLDE